VFGFSPVSLGNVGNVSMCKRILKSQTNSEKGVPFFKIGTFGSKANAYISEELFTEYKDKYSYPRKGEVLISAAGTVGRAIIFDGEPAYFQDSNIVWINNDETIVLNKYLYYFYQTSPWMISEGGTIARLYNDNILKTIICVPPIEKQREIISILDRFYTLCNDISEGLPAEIEARQKQYEYYRDKLLQFPVLS
jgi:type I restriction enzyme S subunit